MPTNLRVRLLQPGIWQGAGLLSKQRRSKAVRMVLAITRKRQPVRLMLPVHLLQKRLLLRRRPGNLSQRHKSRLRMRLRPKMRQHAVRQPRMLRKHRRYLPRAMPRPRPQTLGSQLQRQKNPVRLQRLPRQRLKHQLPT